MNREFPLSQSVPRDLTAGLVVFLVALPLCLGVAFASQAPLFSGLLSGIIGGILVGAISRSSTSVSGPAAGLTAVVATQINDLGSFQIFLMALTMAGVIQIMFGVAKLGFIANFFPSSVIKGLLAAIGVILILKQLPHVFGHDKDPEGDMAFLQPDQENTFSEIAKILGDFHPGAAAIGILSVLLLFLWDQIKPLKKSPIPAPLVVVLFGVTASLVLSGWGSDWAIGASHLVQVPVVESPSAVLGLLIHPNFTTWATPGVLQAALVIALVASLETLLNLEAVDRLDPLQRGSPPNRELVAQGVGNLTAGLLGGIPVTSVIVRSSVNIHAGNRTKLSTIFHGTLLLVCVLFIPTLLNKIPLSCLAAVLFATGCKLAHPKQLKQFWRAGYVQLIPFLTTVIAIVFTDLLIGILIGLGVSIGFILHNNLHRKLHTAEERHLGGDVLRIQLTEQVSFLNRAMLTDYLEAIPKGKHVIIDAQQSTFIDPDIIDLIQDYVDRTAPARNQTVSLIGFGSKFPIADRLIDVDNSTKELQQRLTPAEVLQILKDGNERFRTGQRLTRNLGHEVTATATGQYPLAVILGCIDSRSPAELIFDAGIGDIFNIRIAGNVIHEKVLGSLEYACAVAGTKLIVVMGHTRCGAVNAAVDLFHAGKTASEETGCEHLDTLVSEIQRVINGEPLPAAQEMKAAYVDHIARRNVIQSMNIIRRRSRMLNRLAEEGRILIVGGMYDVHTGRMEFLENDRAELTPSIVTAAAAYMS